VSGSRASPYVVRITNDLYQAPQPVQTVVTSRMMQRPAGAAEAAAANVAAAAVAAAAGGPVARAGVSNRASVHSTTGLVGLHQVGVDHLFGTIFMSLAAFIPSEK